MDSKEKIFDKIKNSKNLPSLSHIISELVVPGSIKPVVNTRIDPKTIRPYEASGIKKNGTDFPIEIRIKDMEYYEKTVKVAPIRDITERKLVEKIKI